MPDEHLQLPLAAALLCLLLLWGCEQPTTAPVTTADPQSLQEPPAPQQPPVTPPPPAAPAAQDAAVITAPASDPPDLESLVLDREDGPFPEKTMHSFGRVPEADWLGGTQQHSGRARLLPDLFGEDSSQDRVNVEGELLLDGSQGTSNMLEGVGMKLKVNTD